MHTKLDFVQTIIATITIRSFNRNHTPKHKSKSFEEAIKKQFLAKEETNILYSVSALFV